MCQKYLKVFQDRKNLKPKAFKGFLLHYFDLLIHEFAMINQHVVSTAA